MEEQQSDNSLEKAAGLLNELQQQLMKYKSALDSIYTASDATEKVSHALVGLTATFEQLHKAQAELAQSFNDTRRALIFTQQRSQQVTKDLDELSQNFTRNINGVMQNATAEIDKKISDSVSGNEIIEKEVRLLRNILLGNILVLFLLMFTFFMYFGKDDSSSVDNVSTSEIQQQPDAAINDDSGSETPLRYSPIDYLKIQVLNGCGKGGVGKEFEDFLEGRNVKISNTENADHFDYLNTIVHSNSSATAEAGTIANYLGLGQERVLPGNPRWRDYDLTIIIGKDYQSLGYNREVR